MGQGVRISAQQHPARQQRANAIIWLCRALDRKSHQRPKSPGKKIVLRDTRVHCSVGKEKQLGQEAAQRSQARTQHTLTCGAIRVHRYGLEDKLSEGLQSAVGVLVVDSPPGSLGGRPVCRWDAREQLQAAAHRQRWAKHRRVSSFRFLHGVRVRDRERQKQAEERQRDTEKMRLKVGHKPHPAPLLFLAFCKQGTQIRSYPEPPQVGFYDCPEPALLRPLFFSQDLVAAAPTFPHTSPSLPFPSRSPFSPPLSSQRPSTGASVPSLSQHVTAGALLR